MHTLYRNTRASIEIIHDRPRARFIHFLRSIAPHRNAYVSLRVPTFIQMALAQYKADTDNNKKNPRDLNAFKRRYRVKPGLAQRTIDNRRNRAIVAAIYPIIVVSPPWQFMVFDVDSTFALQFVCYKVSESRAGSAGSSVSLAQTPRNILPLSMSDSYGRFVRKCVL